MGIEAEIVKTQNNSSAFIYCIENTINDKCYIGYSEDPDKRWEEHQAIARNDPNQKNHSYIHRAIRKYGTEHFIFTVIAYCFSVVEAKLAEKYWIAEMKRQGIQLYNLTDGGDGASGYIPTAETRKKNGDAQRGRKQSEETKTRKSRALKGRFTGKDHPQFGKKHPPEQTQKMIATKMANDEQRLFGANANIEKIRYKHFIEGKSYIDLAIEYGCAEMTVADAIYGRRNYERNPIDLEKWGQYIDGYKLITPEKKAEIRTKYATGDYTYEALGVEYRVSQSAIWRIVKRLNKMDA